MKKRRNLRLFSLVVLLAIIMITPGTASIDSLEKNGNEKKQSDSEKEFNPFQGECSTCHKGLEYHVRHIFGWKFSHRPHIKKQKLPCSRCHSLEPVHGRLIMKKQQCMNCHHREIREGKKSDCKTCHKSQHDVYYSRISFATFKIPNPMAGNVSCNDCHKEKKEQLHGPDKTVCFDCHEQKYEKMVARWQETNTELLTRLRERVRRESLGKGVLAYDTLMLLEKDRSKGIHNPELYEKLIKEAMK